MIDLMPLDRERLRALATDPAPTLGGLCSNAHAVADVVRSVAGAMLDLQERTGAGAPWGGYLARREADGAVVGVCGFKGPPLDQAVEIAYFTFPSYERRGCASAMAGALVAIAFDDAAVAEVIAHTLPEESPSTRVLRRHGFRFEGAAMDDEDGEVWRWSLRRSDWAQPQTARSTQRPEPPSRARQALE